MSAYAGTQDFIVEAPPADTLKKCIHPIKSALPVPNADEITGILKQMSKTKPEDELNCGSCGYNFCRDKAIAVYQSKADISMCMLFLMRKAENIFENILNNTPTAVIVLNEALEVQQINKTALHMMNLRYNSLEPSDFMVVRQTGSNINGKRVYLAEYKKYGKETITYDPTACTIRIRRRAQMNLLIGPPSTRDDCKKMMSLFFSKEGKYIVCGGTTAVLAAEYLGKEVVPVMNFPDKTVPPISRIEGVDLVTEGTVAVNKVLTYAQNYLTDNRSYDIWGYKKDGASRMARLLFEEATDINFYVGKAVNPAHQDTDFPISFNSKMQLVDALADCLREIGKQIKVRCF